MLVSELFGPRKVEMEDREGLEGGETFAKSGKVLWIEVCIGNGTKEIELAKVRIFD